MNARALHLVLAILLAALAIPAVAAAAPGDLDPTFAQDGRQTTRFPGVDRARDVVVQPDGRIVVVGSASDTAADFGLVRYAADGSLDASFGGDGKVTTDFGGSETALDAATLDDGGILVAGASERGIAIARYGPDGSLEAKAASPSSFDGFVRAVALQPDGKVVAVGTWEGPNGEFEDFALARYDQDGTLDTTFGDEGMVTQGGFLDTESRADAVAIQPDGTIVVAGTRAGEDEEASDFAVGRYAPDGERLSRTRTDFGGVDQVTAIAVGPGGAIAVAGRTADDFAVARYTEDGSPDTSFSEDGEATTDFGGDDGAGGVAFAGEEVVVAGRGASGKFALARYDADGSPDGTQTTAVGGDGGAAAVAVAEGGEIVAAGTDGDDFAVARYRAGGSLDPGFAGDGTVLTDLAHGGAQAEAVVRQPDGKLVAVGGTITAAGDPGAFALARYNSDGSPDSSFSGDGSQTTAFPGPADGWPGAGARAAALQPDGKIVVAGFAPLAPDDRRTSVALARYDADGSLDTSFGGGDGRVTTEGEAPIVANDIVVQPDGKLVIVGDLEDRWNVGIVARYHADGSVDTSFASDGQTAIGFGFPPNSTASAVALQPDGRIVVAGTAGGNDPNFAVARLTPDGERDTSFDGDGELTTDLEGSDAATDVVVQGDGAILVAGGSAQSSGDEPARADVALARYLPDGALDPGFAGDGKQTTDFGGAERGSALALLPDGRFVVAGRSTPVSAGGESAIAIARYRPDGGVDPTFAAAGRALTSFPGGARAADVLLQPDGAIVTAGASEPTAGGGVFALARHEGGGDAAPGVVPPPPRGDPKPPAATTVGPPGPTPPVDTTGPRITIPKANRRVTVTRAGVVRFTLGRAAETMRGTVAVRVAGRMRRTAFRVLAGRRAVARIKLARATRMRLARKGRLSARAAITARDARGNATVRVYRFTVVASKPNRRR